MKSVSFSKNVHFLANQNTNTFIQTGFFVKKLNALKKSSIWIEVMDQPNSFFLHMKEIN